MLELIKEHLELRRWEQYELTSNAQYNFLLCAVFPLSAYGIFAPAVQATVTGLKITNVFYIYIYMNKMMHEASFAATFDRMNNIVPGN